MPRKSKATVVITAMKTGGGKKKKRGGRSRPRNGGGGSGPNIQAALTAAYFKSLVNPFENAAPKLGWGCMVPSTVVQAYSRFEVNTASDGSIVIALLPCVKGGILVNTSGVATWTSLDFANTPAIIANCGEGRVISAGLRFFPNLAMTAVPGAMYTGAMVASTAAQFTTLFTSDFTSAPTTHMSIGYAGGSSTGRPVDPDSFEFVAAVVDSNGWTANPPNSNTTLPFSVPYVAYQGSANVVNGWVEAVLNIETTQVVSHSGTTILPDDNTSVPRLCDYWPSFESMWGRIQGSLPHPGRPGEAAAAADDCYVSAMLSGIGSVGSRAAYGVGRLVGHSIFGATSVGLGRAAVQFSGQRLGSQFGGYLQ